MSTEHGCEPRAQPLRQSSSQKLRSLSRSLSDRLRTIQTQTNIVQAWSTATRDGVNKVRTTKAEVSNQLLVRRQSGATAAQLKREGCKCWDLQAAGFE